MEEKLLKLYNDDFKIRYEYQIKDSKKDNEIKMETYMGFVSEYANIFRYELHEKVEKLLLEYKKQLNAWEYVFDWRVAIVLDKYENYFNEKNDLETEIMDFISNSETSYKFDTDIRNYEHILKQIDADIFKEMQKGG